MIKGSEKIAEEKSVSILLGTGILLMPVIFSWFTLRKGYTKKAKLISFFWLVAVIILPGILGGNKQVKPSTEDSIISFDITHNVNSEGLLSFKIKTNTPENTKIILFLESSSGDSLGSSSGAIHNGLFLSENFSRRGSPHLAGKYSLYIGEEGKGSLYKGERLFEPFRYEFQIGASNVTPQSLTKKQKENTLNKFEEIISYIKNHRDDIQHVRATLPLGRGQSGSIYIAKWNQKIQLWEKEINDKHKGILGKGFSAPFCPQGAFYTKLSISNLKLLGIGYVFGDSAIQEKNLKDDMITAEKEITLCRQL